MKFLLRDAYPLRTVSRAPKAVFHSFW